MNDARRQSIADTVHRILIPVDGSDASRSAVAYAAQIATADLVLLHVRNDDSRSMQNDLHALAESYTTAERTVDVDVRDGDVVETILEAAETVDLIVMSTHGRGALGRLVFGSVTDEVVRKGTTPTVLLRAYKHERDVALPKRVVVMLDGSEAAEDALAPGLRIEHSFNIPLVLVHAVNMDEIRKKIREQHQTSGSRALDNSTYEEAHRKASAAAAAYLNEKVARIGDPQVTARVLEGDAAFALLDFLKPDDIAVLTTTGDSGYKRWRLGSVAERLVRQAPCPVLVRHTGE